MSTYKIEFNWSGATWTEYDVIINDFQVNEILYKNLKSADNNCTFSMTPDLDLYNLLRGINTSEVPVRITKDTIPYFYGYIRKTFNIKKAQALQPIKIELVSPSFKLKRKVSQNLNYNNISVTQLITNLLTNAGVTAYTLPTISTLIPGFSVVANEGDTYHQYIERILYEYGYIFYFDGTGSFVTQLLFPNDITTTKVFNGSNCLNEIEQIKTEEIKDGVIVQWYGTKALSNAIVFSDTTNAQNGYKCYIELAPLAYMGNGENDEWYAELDHPEGQVLFASGLNLDIIKDAGITVQVFEQVGNRVKIKVRNTSTTLTQVIKKFDIKATSATIKTELNKSSPTSNLVNGDLEIVEAKYIFDSENADNLASNIAAYYNYSDFQYKLTSKTNYPIGSVVTITDSSIGTNTARIVSKRTQEQTGIISYILEAIDEFIPSSVDHETTYVNPTPSGVINSIQTVTEAGLNSDGTISQPINSNTMVTDITPTGDGLYLTKSYVGLRLGGDWKSYIANDGDFAFKGDLNNFVQWDGTKLQIKGELLLTGNSTITGKISTGSLQSNTYTAGSAGFILNSTGDVEFNNATIRGTIHANAGTFGGTTNGWTIGTGLLTALGTGKIRTGSTTTRLELDSTGLKAYQAGTVRAQILSDGSGYLGASTTLAWTTAGVVTIAGFTINSANGIYAGSGATRVQLKAGSGIWVGADAIGSAPFSVTNAGVLTATGATISGAITATSGSFTGSITANTGTISNWIIDANLLKSASTGARVELNSNLNRVSVFDTSNEKVTMGYLSGLPKNGPPYESTKAYVVNDLTLYNGVIYRCKLAGCPVGTLPTNTTYFEVSTVVFSAADYGFWIRPGSTVQVDGQMEFRNGDMTASDSSFKVLSGSSEVIRIGSDSGLQGLHLYSSSKKKSITPVADAVRITTPSGYAEIGPLNTSWCHFNTDRAAFYFYKNTTINGSITATSATINGALTTTGVLTASSATVNGNITFTHGMSKQISAQASPTIDSPGCTIALIAGDAIAGSTNFGSGGNVYIASGKSTGNYSSDIIFETSDKGITYSPILNNLSTRATINSDGLTIAANNNLTLDDGTGVYKHNYTGQSGYPFTIYTNAYRLGDIMRIQSANGHNAGGGTTGLVISRTGTFTTNNHILGGLAIASNGNGTVTNKACALTAYGNNVNYGLVINADGGTTNIALQVDKGQINIDTTTQSTSTSTGAVVIDGGVGIAGNTYIGGNIITNANIGRTDDTDLINLVSANNVTVNGTLNTTTRLTTPQIGRTDDTDLITLSSANNVTINGNVTVTGTYTGTISTATTAEVANQIRQTAPGTPVNGDIWMV